MKAPYRVIYDMPDVIDGIDCDGIGYAKSTAEDILFNWMIATRGEWKDPMNPTTEEIDEWNYMIYNCAVWIEEYNPDTGEYEEIETFTDEDYRLFGWEEIPEEED